MHRSLSFAILLSLVLLPMIGGIGFQHTNNTTKSEFALSDVVDFERGPTVNLVTNNSAMIFWRTDTPTDATVRFGFNTSILESETNSTLDTDHFITITGLDANTKYYYRVESSGDQSETYHFLTAPEDGDEFHMIVAGDNRPGSTEAPVQPEVFSDLVDLMIAEEPHIVVLTGDFVYRIGTDHSANLAAWKLLTDITDRIGHYAPVIGVIGNHDTGVSSGIYATNYYTDAFVNTHENKTDFSLDYAGVHFTCLDTEEHGLEGHIVGDQYNWFVQDLTDNAGKMKFVFAHRPLYSTTHVGSSLDLNLTEREGLQDLLEEHNVTLFASGHDHSYSWMVNNGVTHLITGGLGAPLYFSSFAQAIYHYTNITVSPSGLDFAAITEELSVADEFSIPLEGPILIFLREMENTSTKPLGEIPTILFSEVPTTLYYSWDGSTNSSTLAGLPGPSGEHTLDVFVENEENEWNHARYVFTTLMPEPTTTETPTTTAPPPDTTLLIVGIIGIVAVVVVVGIIIKVKKS